ncbi:MAG: tetratricopeptide repeat protein [Nitrososphaeraceae archaeon]
MEKKIFSIYQETVSVDYEKENTWNELKARITYCIGVLYFVKDQYLEAIEYFAEYLHFVNYLSRETEKKSVQYVTIKALFYKGRSHSGLQQYQEAINCYLNQLMQLERNYGNGSYRVLYNIGLNYMSSGDNGNALRYFSEALMNLNPLSSVSVPVDALDENFISVDSKQKQYEENDTLRNIAIAYKKLKNFDKAKSINQKIKNTFQHRIDSLADDLSRAESLDKKKEIYKDEIWNLYFEVKNNLALTYVEDGEYKKALDEVRFVDLSDDDLSDKDYYVSAAMLDTKGYIHYKLNNTDEALKYFEKAICKAQ